MTDSVQIKTNPLLAPCGHWAVVTGASDGFGRAFAAQSAREVLRSERLLCSNDVVASAGTAMPGFGAEPAFPVAWERLLTR